MANSTRELGNGKQNFTPRYHRAHSPSVIHSLSEHGKGAP